MNFIIRQARTSDAAAISAMIDGLLRYVLDDPASPEVRHFLDTLTPAATAERIAAPNFSCRVAEGDGGLFGFSALRDGSHLYHLFVRADLHRQGIARALWQQVLAHAESTQFTVNSSPYAVPIYERLGFHAVAGPQVQHGVVCVPMVYDVRC